MPINAAAQLTIQVPGGPTISEAWDVKVNAYDHLSAVIPAAGNATLDIQPGAGVDIALMLITASRYADPATLTYQFNAAGTNYNMGYPHVVAGGDLVNKLNAAPASLKFINTGAADVSVTVLVFRQA